MTDRSEIIDYTLNSGLIRQCVECQVAKSKCDKQWVDDIEQDMWIWMMTYDIEKLADAYKNNHLNALISKVLVNQIFSKTSQFHKNYRRYDRLTDEITPKELNIADE